MQKSLEKCYFCGHMERIPENIDISQYDYPLPDERIARYPLAERDASKLLVFSSGSIGQGTFADLPGHIPAGSLVVFNNTKVIRARTTFHKSTGAAIEILCLEPFGPAGYEAAMAATGSCSWVCMVGNLKKWKGEPLQSRVFIGGKESVVSATLEGRHGNDPVVRFAWDAAVPFGQVLEAMGTVPIPPYLARESEAIDTIRYQTVYSRHEGSVAAPTAGLHFTDSTFAALAAKGVTTADITLHVGAGTFLPVKEENAIRHTMHTEHFVVRRRELEKIAEKWGGITAVGTTSVRTLESLAALGYRVLSAGTPFPQEPVSQWEAYTIEDQYDGRELLEALRQYMADNDMDTLCASTQIMIVPGFRFRVVDRMVTNFHQPQSTLLLLVSAFTSGEWQRIYDYALDNGFRFLSYGDSSLLWRL